ncbi:hypothetical protein HDV00_001604 [Rhizophlyctis rosea]|nr:hypothetical protein HDV00_001604 [Rhizophlyctis rosea]
MFAKPIYHIHFDRAVRTTRKKAKGFESLDVTFKNGGTARTIATEREWRKVFDLRGCVVQVMDVAQPGHLGGSGGSGGNAYDDVEEATIDVRPNAMEGRKMAYIAVEGRRTVFGDNILRQLETDFGLLRTVEKGVIFLTHADDMKTFKATERLDRLLRELPDGKAEPFEVLTAVYGERNSKIPNDGTQVGDSSDDEPSTKRQLRAAKAVLKGPKRSVIDGKPSWSSSSSSSDDESSQPPRKKQKATHTPHQQPPPPPHPAQKPQKSTQQPQRSLQHKQHLRAQKHQAGITHRRSPRNTNSAPNPSSARSTPPSLQPRGSRYQPNSSSTATNAPPLPPPQPSHQQRPVPPAQLHWHPRLDWGTYRPNPFNPTGFAQFVPITIQSAPQVPPPQHPRPPTAQPQPAQPPRTTTQPTPAVAARVVKRKK